MSVLTTSRPSQIFQIVNVAPWRICHAIARLEVLAGSMLMRDTMTPTKCFGSPTKWLMAFLHLILIAGTSQSCFGQDTAASQHLATHPTSRPDKAPKELWGTAAIEHSHELLDTGKANEAVEEMSRIIDSASGTLDEHYAALVLRAMAYARTGKANESLRDAQDILDAKESDVAFKNGAIYARLIVHKNAANWDAVVKDANLFLSMNNVHDDDWTRTKVVRALAYQQLGQSGKALEDVNDAIRLAPSPAVRAFARMSRIAIYVDMHDIQSATDDLTKVIEATDTPADSRATARDALKSIRETSTTKSTTRSADKR